MTSIVLNNGVPIPQLGFGVYKIAPQDTVDAVRTALDVGYRSIDTATLYRNEAEVGVAVAESGVPREDVFVTTKLWNDDHGHDAALAAFEVSLRRIGLEYVDMYLVHWPCPDRGLYVETWRALERLHAEGRVRVIGVSNFQPSHLRRLLDDAEVVPAVNQIELHPWLQQRELRDLHAELGIVTEAWSPLARGGDRLLGDPTILRIADRLGVTPAQVVLRWHVQLGNVVIPKSATRARIRENVAVWDFLLTDEDMRAVGSLDAGIRLGPDPDTLC